MRHGKKLSDFTMADVGEAVTAVVADLTPQVKQPGEFTVSEFQAAVLVNRGVELSYRQAAYRLSNLEQRGDVERVPRLDPDTGREIYCYRRLGEDDTVSNTSGM